MWGADSETFFENNSLLFIANAPHCSNKTAWQLCELRPLLHSLQDVAGGVKVHINSKKKSPRTYVLATVYPWQPKFLLVYSHAPPTQDCLIRGGYDITFWKYMKQPVSVPNSRTFSRYRWTFRTKANAYMYLSPLGRVSPTQTHIVHIATNSLRVKLNVYI